MNECAMILKSQPEFHPYVSIVLDEAEAQDFGMAAPRLPRALAGEEHTNDLFIVGDAHQRVCENKLTLSQRKLCLCLVMASSLLFCRFDREPV